MLKPQFRASANGSPQPTQLHLLSLNHSVQQDLALPSRPDRNSRSALEI
jgi:hypothetical protein